MNRISQLSIIAAMALISASYGADWVVDGNAAWNSDGNWANPSTFPNGVSAVADFSTINLSNNRTVSLNAPITIGTMLFGDTDANRTYTIANGTGGPLTFDSGGTSILTRATGGATITANVVLNDNLVVNGAFTFQTGTISGPGGFTVNSGKLSIRQAVNNYTGQTIINSNASVLVYSDVPPGNFTVNGNGQYHGYYLHTMSRNLGSGPNSIRFPDSSPGTAPGFEWNNNMNVRFNNDASSVVQWGGGDFDMETLRMKNTGGTLKVITFHNILDLNGGERSIQIQSTTNVTQQYAVMAGEIRDTAGGASLTKTGNGRLVISVAGAYDGDTTINAGILQLNAVNVANENSTVTIADSGATLTLNFVGDDEVKFLYTGTTPRYAGEYGHTNSGADNGGLGVGALDTYFGAGTGKLIVTGGPPDWYSPSNSRYWNSRPTSTQALVS